jgi:hypothetical protein
MSTSVAHGHPIHPLTLPTVSTRTPAAVRLCRSVVAVPVCGPGRANRKIRAITRCLGDRHPQNGRAQVARNGRPARCVPWRRRLMAGLPWGRSPEALSLAKFACATSALV